MKKIGEEFFKKTKFSVDTIGKKDVDWNKKPEIYKIYKDREIIKLPEVKPENSPSFTNVILSRKSVRDYKNEPVDIEKLSFLLWACTGVQRVEFGYEFRTSPSAGALYPIETYIVANNVRGLKKGVYHYRVDSHALEVLKLGDFRKQLAYSTIFQYFVSHASIVFIWTAIFERSTWKYGDRAYRYIFIEAGHIAQNLALASVSCGLGSCQIGAFFDDEVNSIIGVDGVSESCVYLSCVGYPL